MNIGLLHPFEAVKSGDMTIVQFPADGNKYTVDKKVLPSTYNRQIAIDANSVIEKYTQPVKTLSKIVCDDGSEYTIAEYRAIQSQFDEDDYPNLEVEFEHRKLLQKLNSGEFIYDETEEKYEPVEIKIVGELKDTGSDFITTPLVLGNARFSNYDNSFYRVNVMGVIGDAVNKFAQDNDLKIEVPDHSGYKWCKVDGEYVFTNKDFEKMAESGVLCYQTLQKAKECESLFRNKVYKHLSGKFSNSKVDGVLAKEVYSELMSVLNLLSDVNTTKKLESKLSAAKTKIRNLKDRLTGE